MGDRMADLKIVDNEITGNPEAAQQIREVADMVEQGIIRDIVIVYDNRVEKHFVSWGEFTDRWRLLGAIEYAKAHVLDN